MTGRAGGRAARVKSRAGSDAHPTAPAFIRRQIPNYELLGEEGLALVEHKADQLLAEIGDGRGARALDVGCGVVGWLRVLSEWVGPDGNVTGTDIDELASPVAGGTTFTLLQCWGRCAA